LWKYSEHRDASTAAGAGANSWLNTFFAEGPDIEAGQTVLRTRLQMNLTFGWQSVVLSGGDIEHPWYEGQTNIVGLYANPGLSATGTPPSPATSLSDGFWVQNNAMTLSQVSYYVNKLGQTSAEAVFKLDTGLSDSFGKRGPYTIDVGGVFLAWDFNAFGSYWLSDDTEFLGWMGGFARWAVLVESAA
jgi:hypothetical protein